MSKVKKLTGKKCSLIPIKDRDAYNWAKWYNDIYISLPESNVYDVVTSTNTKKAVADLIKDDAYVFTIVENTNETPIGRIELEVDEKNKSGSFGIIVGEKDFWGKGIGKEATQLLLNFAFTELKIHNMMLGVYGFNKRAYNLYKLIGFKEMGRKREYQAAGGKRYDMIFMDMLSHEFKERYDGVL